jgi:hypothetical protein
MIAIDLGPRFELGQIVVTTDAAMKIPPGDIESALRRHSRGDWGDLDSKDRQQNDRAVERGGTIASIFRATNGDKFYVLTEADRSVTTVLMPEEY